MGAGGGARGGEDEVQGGALLAGIEARQVLDGFLGCSFSVHDSGKALPASSSRVLELSSAHVSIVVEALERGKQVTRAQAKLERS
jgi:hypothetical protein